MNTKNRALDEFQPGASFDLAIELYRFDESLRHAVFRELDAVEGRVKWFVYRFAHERT